MTKKQREQLESIIRSWRLELDIGINDVPREWRLAPNDFLNEVVAAIQISLPHNSDGTVPTVNEYKEVCGSHLTDEAGRTNTEVFEHHLDILARANELLASL